MAEQDDIRLSQYWDALVAGTPDSVDIEPSIADPLRHAHSLFAAPKPDSARERARQRIFASDTQSQESDMSTLVLHPPAVNGRSTISPPLPFPAVPPALKRPLLTRRMLLSLAAALLIAFGGIGGYFAQERFFSSAPTSGPAVIPAATPESGWHQFRGGAARTGHSADPGPGGDLDLRWTFTAGQVLNSVISADDTVFAYGRKGDLYALDAVTGVQRWAVDLSENEFTGENRYPIPAVESGVLFVGTFDGSLVALNASDGSVIWQRAISNQPITGSPAVADGRIYLTTSEGTVLALDTADGRTLWESTGDTTFQDVAPAVGDGHVFILNAGGDLEALDADSGESTWIADLNEGIRVAAYSGGTVYAADGDGSYSAVDGATGEVRWTSEPQQGQALNPLVTPNLFIATNQENALQALDLATGQPLWSVPGPGTSASPHASANALYALSSDLTSYVAYDLGTGEELGRVAVDGVGSTAAISGTTLVLSGNAESGVVRSFGPGEGEPNAVVAGPSVAMAVATAAPAEETQAPTAVASDFDSSQVRLIWESAGSATDPMAGLVGITIGPDGNLYVADDARAVIEIFAPDGTHLETWGEPGSGPGQFQYPGTLGFDADGNIYVFDLGNQRIQKFSPERTFLTEWGTMGEGNGQFNELFGIVDPAAGRIYTTEFLNNRVQVFDLAGNFLDKWGSAGRGDGQFNHPNSGLAIDADGNLWVGESANGSLSRIQKFDPDGRWLATLGGSDTPDVSFSEVFGIAFDAAGNLYAADYWTNSILIFSPDLVQIGVIEDVPGAGAFLNPTGLRFDAEGFLYVSDYGNGRLLKLELPPLA